MRLATSLLFLWTTASALGSVPNPGDIAQILFFPDNGCRVVFYKSSPQKILVPPPPACFMNKGTDGGGTTNAAGVFSSRYVIESTLGENDGAITPDGPEPWPFTLLDYFQQMLGSAELGPLEEAPAPETVSPPPQLVQLGQPIPPGSPIPPVGIPCPRPGVIQGECPAQNPPVHGGHVLPGPVPDSPSPGPEDADLINWLLIFAARL